MNNDLLYCMKRPFIKEKDGIIIDVNTDFLNLTKYNKDELCGKNITEVLDLLFRCNHRINIEDKKIETVLFTKSFDVRFVKVKKYINLNDINLYSFYEISNSRLDDKLLFVESLINDNEIGIGIYTVKDLKLIKANQKYLDYMPKPFNSKEAIYGKCMHEFLSNFQKDGTCHIISTVLKNNKPVYLTEVQDQILDDTDYWNKTVTPISVNGEVKYIMFILENVTKRVLSRKHVQIKNKQLGSILESVEDIISIVDKNGKYIRKSNIIKGLTGENEGGLLGSSSYIGKYYDFNGNPIPLKDLYFMKVIQGVKVKDEKLKYVCNDHDYYINFNAIPIFDKNSKFEMGVLVTQDITELVKNTKLITNQSKELGIIFDNMSDGLAVIDKYGNFLKRNKAFKNIFTINMDESFLRKVGDSILNGQKFYNEDDNELTINKLPTYKVLKGEKVKEQRIVIKKRYSKTYLDFNAIPIFDENGDFEYGIIFSHDVTHIVKNNNRIKQEQQLIIKAEQEKLEAAEKTIEMKDEFISLISHEFKTPLNVIFSAIQLIEYIYIDQLPDKVKHLIKNIKQNTFRQLRLVNNLLDITRLNSGRFKLHVKSVDIVSLTKQISLSVKLYSNQKNIKLLYKCSLLYKEITTDYEKLERIILNLLSNAIKFTDGGGTVIVSLDENKETGMIIIEISDSGIGIPKDKQKLIFERFGQVDSNLSRRAEGTGIGLSLVKKLVDILNGKIELESELGVGSTFRISFPVNQDTESDENEVFIDNENRLVDALNVEFSDIYL